MIWHRILQKIRWLFRHRHAWTVIRNTWPYCNPDEYRVKCRKCHEYKPEIYLTANSARQAAAVATANDHLDEL